jgi:protein-disulfide isomerase
MGGAARNDKRRRQEEAARRLAAAGIQVPPKKNNTPLVVAGVVVVVALLIGGGLLWYRSQSSASTTPTYTASASGAVVTAGSGGPAIDVYEDFLCPNCERFEQRDGAAITSALNSGKLTVRYHAIAILDQHSTPAGYSTRAANAAVCAAAAGVFPAYHQQLFAQQPAEGSAGLTNDQLVAIGTQAGAKGDFAGCVTKATYAAAVKAETAKAVADPNLQTSGQFGTPTVAQNGKKIDLNDASWLSKITG